MPSLPSNEIDRFACAPNQAHWTCWARVCALANDCARFQRVQGTAHELLLTYTVLFIHGGSQSMIFHIFGYLRLIVVKYLCKSSFWPL